MGNVKHTYTTLGGKIVREAYGTYTMDYFYDNDSRPYKMVVKNGTSTVCTGYFVLNLQGDVIAIVDDAGVVAVEYEYDAWGKEIYHDTHTDQGNILYQYNALKYRGYYYDAETGFYYVSSRYYDPEIGRFINADNYELLLENQGNLFQYNLYTYCWNNPINMLDGTGESAEVALTAWASGMNWLIVLDGPFPIGDLIYSLGIVILAVEVLNIGCNIKTDIEINIKTDIALSKRKDKNKDERKERSEYPIGRRIDFNSRKKAKEAAKKAGGGKEPEHHPTGYHGNKKPHFHPNVKNKFRMTPHEAAMHDHFYYPR